MDELAQGPAANEPTKLEGAAGRPGHVKFAAVPSEPTSLPSSETSDGASPSDRHRSRSAAIATAVAEIDEEVDRKRASGQVPAGFEEELERAFLELSPRDGAGHALRRALDSVDTAAAMDFQVPVVSRRPGGALVKRMVRSAIGWYVRFFMAQVNRLALAVGRALHVVADDVESLRAQISDLKEPMFDYVESPSRHGGRWWTAIASAALSESPGVVLCGDGADHEVLGALREAGIGAYGIDRTGRCLPSAARAGLDMRMDSLMHHVRSLREGELGGAVLEGSVQWLGPLRCDELVSMLGSRLRHGGVLVVSSLTPEAWKRNCDPVMVDLAASRPLHPKTWEYLMSRNGFGDVRVHVGGADLLGQLRSQLQGTRSVDEKLLPALESLFDGPDEYVVIGTLGAH